MSGHVWRVDHRPHPDNANVMQSRWDCECGRKGAWTERRTASKGGAAHQRTAPEQTAGPKFEALQALLSFTHPAARD